MTNEHVGGDELSAEEIAEAAVTLATLPEGDRLPAHVRERVEVRARALLGERARLHARRRADDRAREPSSAPGRAPQSTTSAGSQVYGAPDAPDEQAGRSPARLFAWGGWALAAAAAVSLFVTSRATMRPTAGASAAADLPTVELQLEGEGRGALRYDPSRGTGSLGLAVPPAVDPTRESLQLWVAFEGDRAPRPVALLEGPALALPDAARVCQGDRVACVAIRDAWVTREALGGSLVFSERKVVLRASRGSP